MNLTPDQITQLRSLGINISKSKLPLLPLFSLSGLSLLSFGGLLLFKSKTNPTSPPSPQSTSPFSDPSPSVQKQVPKSIQHYLLASQQYFTQALSSQSQKDDPSTLELLNLAITTASEAIRDYPQDYRGWEQRGRIYLSLSDSQPQLISIAISDLSRAHSLNPTSADITRTLASLYAKNGDSQHTLTLLAQTVALEPTKAQNFYDLARLQQLTGQLPQALDTYSRLLTIVTDPSQRLQISSEIDSLKSLTSQHPVDQSSTTPTTSISPPAPNPEFIEGLTGPQLQATLPSSGLIIAAPSTSAPVSVSTLNDSNSLSGTGTLTSGSTSLILNNSHLSTTSQVYLTTTKGGKNLSLQVLSKTPTSFTVGLISPAPENIEFKWWIVN